MPALGLFQLRKECQPVPLGAGMGKTAIFSSCVVPGCPLPSQWVGWLWNVPGQLRLHEGQGRRLRPCRALSLRGTCPRARPPVLQAAPGVRLGAAVSRLGDSQGLGGEPASAGHGVRVPCSGEAHHPARLAWRCQQPRLTRRHCQSSWRRPSCAARCPPTSNTCLIFFFYCFVWGWAVGTPGARSGSSVRGRTSAPTCQHLLGPADPQSHRL